MPHTQSNHTGQGEQYLVGLVRRTGRIPAHPSAPGPPWLLTTYQPMDQMLRGLAIIQVVDDPRKKIKHCGLTLFVDWLKNWCSPLQFIFMAYSMYNCSITGSIRFINHISAIYQTIDHLNMALSLYPSGVRWSKWISSDLQSLRLPVKHPAVVTKIRWTILDICLIYG